MRRICDRGRTKRSCRRFGCCCLCAENIGFACISFIWRRAQALDELRAARAEGLPVSVETCPHYLHFTAEDNRRWGDALQVRAADSKPRKPRKIVAGAARWSDRPCGDGSFSVPSVDEAAGNGKFQDCLGRYCESFRGAAGDVDRRQPQRFYACEISRDGWPKGPRELAGCGSRKGRIAAGYDADLVVFDAGGGIHGRRRNACITGTRFLPYMGEKLRGVVKATYLRGKQVFAEGAFPGEPIGREYRS